MLQLLKLPDQTVRVLVEGKSRARVTGFVPRTDFFQATIERIPDGVSDARKSRLWSARSRPTSSSTSS
ncbi:MAG: LON peptidase substrate-binding domain-containing protein [Rhizomicrobium sp.]